MKERETNVTESYREKFICRFHHGVLCNQKSIYNFFFFFVENVITEEANVKALFKTLNYCFSKGHNLISLCSCQAGRLLMTYASKRSSRFLSGST